MPRNKYFIIKIKGTFVNSSDYIPYRNSQDEIMKFYRKVDAIKAKQDMFKTLRQYNKLQPKSQYKKLSVIIIREG